MNSDFLRPARRAAAFFQDKATDFAGDKKGVAFAIFAMAAVPIIASLGVATDVARGYLIKNRLTEAVDAASLAAGRQPDPALRQADAERFFWANFGHDYLGTTITGGPTAVSNDDLGTITVTATAAVPTTFMGAVGFNTVDIGARAVVTRQLSGMELMLVIDNTGSMDSSGKMEAAQQAAKDLLSILYAGSQTLDDVWVGLVPYVTVVNVGDAHTSWLQPDFDLGDYYPDDWRGWTGCVVARDGDADRTDDPPNLDPIIAFFWPNDGYSGAGYGGGGYGGGYGGGGYGGGGYGGGGYGGGGYGGGGYGGGGYGGGGYGGGGGGPSASDDSYNVWPDVVIGDGWSGRDERGPNRGCVMPMTPLTPYRNRLEDQIDLMEPRFYGGTMINVGLVWGWRALSPRWRGLWGGDTPATLPLDYDEPATNKVIILLTDGENSYSPGEMTAYGKLEDGMLGTTSRSAAENELDNRTAQTCAAVKAAGIELYTITFQQNNPGVQNLMRTCASEPQDEHYFNSPTNQTLRDNFKLIAGKLSKLRISE